MDPGHGNGWILYAPGDMCQRDEAHRDESLGAWRQTHGTGNQRGLDDRPATDGFRGSGWWFLGGIFAATVPFSEVQTERPCFFIVLVGGVFFSNMMLSYVLFYYFCFETFGEMIPKLTDHVA